MGGPSPARAAGCGCLGFIGSRGYNAALVSGCADAQAVAPLVGTGLESLKTHSDEVAGQTGRSRFLGAHGRGGFRGLHDQRGTRTLEHQNGVTGPDCRAGMALTVRAIYPFPVLRHSDKKGGSGTGGLFTG